MCGCAKLPDDVSEIKLDLKIDFDQISNYQPRWNAAPTSKLPVVVSAAGSRILTLMRWGLIPSWAKDPKLGYSTFNARAETLATRAAFRDAWQAGRRCLVLADGYYEWRDTDNQPFAVALANRGPMTLAALSPGFFVRWIKEFDTSPGSGLTLSLPMRSIAARASRA
jgi:putative SOS response-associated peptidase YedK